MNYHYKLKNLPFDFKPFDVMKNDNLEKFKKRNNTEAQTVLEKSFSLDECKIYNKEFVDWIDDNKLELEDIRYFESEPFCSYHLHKDLIGVSNEDTDQVKFNFIFDSFETNMTWYKIRASTKGELYLNSQGYPIYRYLKETCDIIFTTDVNSHCMINSGVIHDLVNGYNNGINRKCYSFAFSKINWNESVERFKEFLN